MIVLDFSELDASTRNLLDDALVLGGPGEDYDDQDFEDDNWDEDDDGYWDDDHDPYEGE